MYLPIDENLPSHPIRFALPDRPPLGLGCVGGGIGAMLAHVSCAIKAVLCAYCTTQGLALEGATNDIHLPCLCEEGAPFATDEAVPACDSGDRFVAGASRGDGHGCYAGQSGAPGHGTLAMTQNGMSSDKATTLCSGCCLRAAVAVQQAP